MGDSTPAPTAKFQPPTALETPAHPRSGSGGDCLPNVRLASRRVTFDPAFPAIWT